MHFCRLRNGKPHQDPTDPTLTLYGAAIPVVQEVKFLGLIFDSKLSFLPHLRYLKKKCIKALNLLRVLADQNTLLQLYRALIRSKLDYGCIVYGSARPSYLRMLDPIQNIALRLCLGAFRTSPASSLCVMANEPPLQLRRQKLTLQYCVKLASNPFSPDYSCVFNPQFKVQFDKKPNQITTLGIRTSSPLQKIGLIKKDIVTNKIHVTAPWLLARPAADLELHCYHKSSTSPEIFKSKFLEIRHNFREYDELHTDGSKDGARVSSAAICKDVTKTAKLDDRLKRASLQPSCMLSYWLMVSFIEVVMRNLLYSLTLYHILDAARNLGVIGFCFRKRKST